MAAPGVAPAAWVSQTPPRVASGSRPALLRGSAFNGWTGTERRRRKPPGHAEGSALRSAPRKYGSEVERRHKWSAGRRACLAKARGAFARCQDDQAPFGAPLPHVCEGKGNDGGPRADQTTGTMNHACMNLSAANLFQHREQIFDEPRRVLAHRENNQPFPYRRPRPCVRL